MKRKLLAILLAILLVMQVFAPTAMASGSVIAITVTEDNGDVTIAINPTGTAHETAVDAFGRLIITLPNADESDVINVTGDWDHVVDEDEAGNVMVVITSQDSRYEFAEENGDIILQQAPIRFHIPDVSGAAGTAVTVTLPFTNPGTAFTQFIVHWEAPLTLVPGSMSFPGWPNPAGWSIVGPLVPASGPAGLQWIFTEEPNLNDGAISLQLNIPVGHAPGLVGEIWVVGGPNTIDEDGNLLAVESNRGRISVPINITADEEDGEVTVEVDPDDTNHNLSVDEDGNLIITLPDADEDDVINVNVPGDWDYDIDEDENGNVIVIITPPDGYEFYEDEDGDIILRPIDPPVIDITVDEEDGEVTVEVDPDDTNHNLSVDEDGNLIITLPDADEDDVINVDVPEDWDVDFDTDSDGNVIVIITPPDGYEFYEDEDGDITLRPVDPPVVDIDVDEEDGNLTITVTPPDTNYTKDTDGDGNLVITLPPGTEVGDVTLPNNDWDVEIGTDGDGNTTVTIIPPPGNEILEYPPGSGEYIVRPIPPTVPNHVSFMIGDHTGHLMPHSNVTRAEATEMLFRLSITDPTFRNTHWRTTNNFADVNTGRWFNNAISTMHNAGLFGVRAPGSNFYPDAFITRAELMSMAAWWNTRFGTDVDLSVLNGTNLFPDIDGHWAADAINTLALLGVVIGDQNGNANPDELLTRAQVAAIIIRMLDRVPEDVNGLLMNDKNEWPDNQNENAWYFLYLKMATHTLDYERAANGYIEVTEVWPHLNWALLTLVGAEADDFYTIQNLWILEVLELQIEE